MQGKTFFWIILILIIVGVVWALFANYWNSNDQEIREVNVSSQKIVTTISFNDEEPFFYEYRGLFGANSSGKGTYKPGTREILRLQPGEYEFVITHEEYYELIDFCKINITKKNCDFEMERVGNVKILYSNASKKLRILNEGGVVKSAIMCIGYKDFSTFDINITKTTPSKKYFSDYDFCHEYNNLSVGFIDYLISGNQVNGEFWVLFDYSGAKKASVINNFKY